MKIPFTLDAWLKDKSQKVENKYGKEVHLLEYDLRLENSKPIIGYEERGGENLRYAESDLFIVTPEPELSEMEIRLLSWLSDDNTIGRIPMEEMKRVVKARAAELLTLAREQFIKDGYVIEKKAFRDAVENISDKHRAEMSVEYSIHCKVENGTRHAIMNWEAFQKVAQKFIDIGKAEALKDLPRWKKASGKERFSERMIVLAGDNDLYCTNYAEEGEYYLPFPILEKLPKEDESHE